MNNDKICTTLSGEKPCGQAGVWALALGALGVVYGDIGTSPLYAVKECFHGMHAVAATETNIFGVLSLIFWSLTIVVGVKYVIFILKADNKGEGGIFALLALVPSQSPRISPMARKAMTAAAIFGAALLYGDGVITPAISVLSAVEGVGVAAEGAKPYILPITCVVLFFLFYFQYKGTEAVGRIFGPVMLAWFAALSISGIAAIIHNPHTLAAVNPLHALRFFAENRFHGMVVLGSVVLCITGGEALYADLGHFGRPAIRRSWTVIVFPALLLNYFGQGALLLENPAASVNPFYGLFPKALIYPMTALSTMAAIIASQAMITGVFSLTQQAVQLGYCPRVHIVHTSEHTKGQIYIPEVNYALMLACLALVLSFQESSRLAAAYGIAVTAAMGITSFLYFYAVTETFKKSYAATLALVAVFLLFDLTYLGANVIKIADGGWITLGIAAAISVMLTTWKQGRAIIADKYRKTGMDMSDFLADVEKKQPTRAPGMAVFMTISPVGAPAALLHHYKHNRVLHEQVLLLSIITRDVPVVPEDERYELTDLGQGFHRLVAGYGFMESPFVPTIMKRARDLGLSFNPAATSYFLGRETLLATGKSGMSRWRKALFVFMSRNVPAPTAYFGLPPNRVIELGAQIKL